MHARTVGLALGAWIFAGCMTRDGACGVRACRAYRTPYSSSQLNSEDILHVRAGAYWIRYSIESSPRHAWKSGEIQPNLAMSVKAGLEDAPRVSKLS